MSSDTRYVILGLLAKKPSYGYELATSFNAIFGPARQISSGQVYGILRSFREARWAEYAAFSQGKREQKIHQITDAGDRVFTEWQARPCVAQAPQDTLYLKFALAGPQDAPLLLRDIIQREQSCLDLLHRYKKNERASLLPDDASEWETLSCETLHEVTSISLHGELDWLSKTRKRIEHFLERLQNLIEAAGDQLLTRSNDSTAA